MSLRSLFSRCVLVLLLLWAQQHAVLHWLSHATHAVAAHSQTDGACGDCAGLAPFGAALPSGAVMPPALGRADVFPQAGVHAGIGRRVALAYLSRAPPAVG